MILVVIVFTMKQLITVEYFVDMEQRLKAGKIDFLTFKDTEQPSPFYTQKHKNFLTQLAR